MNKLKKEEIHSKKTKVIVREKESESCIVYLVYFAHLYNIDIYATIKKLYILLILEVSHDPNTLIIKRNITETGLYWKDKNWLEIKEELCLRWCSIEEFVINFIFFNLYLWSCSLNVRLHQYSLCVIFDLVTRSQNCFSLHFLEASEKSNQKVPMV